MNVLKTVLIGVVLFMFEYSIKKLEKKISNLYTGTRGYEYELRNDFRKNEYIKDSENKIQNIEYSIKILKKISDNEYPIQNIRKDISDWLEEFSKLTQENLDNCFAKFLMHSYTIMILSDVLSYYNISKEEKEEISLAIKYLKRDSILSFAITEVGKYIARFPIKQ